MTNKTSFFIIKYCDARLEFVAHTLKTESLHPNVFKNFFTLYGNSEQWYIAEYNEYAAGMKLNVMML